MKNKTITKVIRVDNETKKLMSFHKTALEGVKQC